MEPTQIRFNAASIGRLEPAATRYAVRHPDIPGFEVRVSPGGTKTYRLLYWKDGRDRSYTIGRHGKITPEQATRLAREKLAEVTLGGDPRAGKTQSRRKASIPTVREFVAGPYTEYVRGSPAHRSPEQTLQRLLSSAFSAVHDKRLDDVTGQVLDKWEASRSVSPAGR